MTKHIKLGNSKGADSSQAFVLYDLKFKTTMAELKKKKIFHRDSGGKSW